MKIGEAARRAGIAPRLVRYYEQQGLLSADRSANGYRTYSEDDVARLTQVARMVRAGLPTKVVKALVDLEDATAAGSETCPRSVAELLAHELGSIEDRLHCLTRSRDQIREALARTEHAALLSETRATTP